MVKIPHGLKGKDLTDFLIQNKDELIRQKKALPVKYADGFDGPVSYFNVKGSEVTKAEPGELESQDVVRVRAVANAANWCDSHMDVLLPDCWKKTIKERKGLIPHLHSHIHTYEAEVGDVVGFYSQDIALSELGLNKAGSTQCLVMESDVKREYNEKLFKKYKAGKVRQHSIALCYVKIDLAINDKSSAKEYDFWQKHVENVINREVVEEKGYFWVVSEIKLLENSAVLFGSNVLTPTLNVKSFTDNEPDITTTQKQPSIDEQKEQQEQLLSFLKTVKLS